MEFLYLRWLIDGFCEGIEMKAWLLLWFVLNPWWVFCDPGIYVPGLENASGYSVQFCFNVYVSVQYLCVIMFRLTILTHLLYGSWLSLNSNDWKKGVTHIYLWYNSLILQFHSRLYPFIYKCFVTFSWSFHCFVSIKKMWWETGGVHI